MPTIMKRLFSSPPPQEFHTFQHWKASQSPPAKEDRHTWIALSLLILFGISLITAFVCVLVFVRMLDQNQFAESQKAWDAFTWSGASAFISLGLFIGHNLLARR